jgi:hypothetical protein
MPRDLQWGFLSPHQQARRVGFRMRFFPQERSTETSYSSVPELSPVSCPKTPMTCQENSLAPRRCPAPTRLWALQAMYALLQCRRGTALSWAMHLFVPQAQSQRRVALPTANGTFAVGVGTPGTLANSSLGSGWQVSEFHLPPRFCSFTGPLAGVGRYYTVSPA